MKWSGKIAVPQLVAVLIALLMLFLIDLGIREYCSVPPLGAIDATIWVIKRRVLRFARENNRLPDNIYNLPEIAGMGNSTTDWWGNQIRFSVDSKGTRQRSKALGSGHATRRRWRWPDSSVDFNQLLLRPVIGRTKWLTFARTRTHIEYGLIQLARNAHRQRCRAQR